MKITSALILLAILCGCSKKEERPSVSFEGVYEGFYDVIIPEGVEEGAMLVCDHERKVCTFVQRGIKK